MRQDEWTAYWRRRCVLAENLLIALSASLEGAHQADRITAHFKDIANGAARQPACVPQARE